MELLASIPIEVILHIYVRSLYKIFAKKLYRSKLYLKILYGVAKAHVMKIGIFRPGVQVDLAAFKRHVAPFFFHFLCALDFLSC